MSISTRAAAVMHASVPAKRLTRAPKSMSSPSTGAPATRGQNAHGRGAGAQILPGGVKAEHFRIGADGEEDAGESGALHHGAWDCFEGIARFRPQRGRALETDKAEQRQHQAKAQAAARHAMKMQLVAVQVPTVPRQQEDDHDEIRLTETASIHSIRRAEICTSR